MNPLAVHFGLIKASDMLLLSDDADANADAPERILAGNRRNRPANKAGKLRCPMHEKFQRYID